MYLLTNPLATWQAALVMIIMAAQGTLFGGAIKMLTKKLEYIQDKLDKEKEAGVITGYEKNDLERRINLIEKENDRLNTDLDNAHAEIIAVKRKLYSEELEELKKT